MLKYVTFNEFTVPFDADLVTTKTISNCVYFQKYRQVSARQVKHNINKSINKLCMCLWIQFNSINPLYVFNNL